jgi:transcriptional regulator of heat shock response
MKKTSADIIGALSKNITLPPPTETAQLEKRTKELQDDYDFSRKTYRDLVQISKDSLSALVVLAQDSEHPRTYEVLANMLKSTAEITDRLVDTQLRMKKIEAVDKLSRETDEFNPEKDKIFVGSTEDLQKYLKMKKAKSDAIDVTPPQ